LKPKTDLANMVPVVPIDFNFITFRTSNANRITTSGDALGLEQL